MIYLNVLAILGTIVLPLVSMAMRGEHTTRLPGSQIHAVAMPRADDFFLALSIIAFAFSSQFMVTEIISEMENPQEFPQAYVYLAAPFQFFAFLTVGLVAYHYVGDNITGMVLDNLPFDWTFQLSSVCLVFLTVASILIKGQVLCRAIHKAWDEAGVNDESMLGWASWCMIVCVVVAVSWVVSQIIPFFADLVQMIGSTLSPVNCFIVPVLMYIRWMQDFGGKNDQISPFEWSVIALELVFAVILMVAGTYYSARTLVANWDTYGPPF